MLIYEKWHLLNFSDWKNTEADKFLGKTICLYEMFQSLNVAVGVR